MQTIPASATAHRRDRTGALARWLLGLVCLAGIAACGGSGSSGFDSRALEDRAIQRALDTATCQDDEGLTICVADKGQPEPDATPTPGPSGSPTPTSTPDGSRTVTPTPTALPARPNVDTNLDGRANLPCAPRVEPSDAPCSFDFQFQASGVAAGALYRVALRTVEPPGEWFILPEPVTSGPADAPRFDQGIELADSAPGAVTYQIAVLVFVEPPGSLPASVHVLAESGADLAFITQPLSAAR